MEVALFTAVVMSVWDGVFTADQAMRGKEAYQNHCVGCHGEDLRGRSGRPLVGERFWQDWSEDRLSSLFAVVQDTMPRTKPHSLDESTYADIVAFVLQENGIPAGSRLLTRDSTADVQVVRQGGPGPVPNFSLVAVIGCLTHPSATAWTVSHASEPVRTRDPEPSPVDGRGGPVPARAFDNTFVLMDAESAAKGHEGWRAEVKGLLIRGTPDKINITSIQALSSGCQP